MLVLILFFALVTPNVSGTAGMHTTDAGAPVQDSGGAIRNKGTT